MEVTSCVVVSACPNVSPLTIYMDNENLIKVARRKREWF